MFAHRNFSRQTERGTEGAACFVARSLGFREKKVCAQFWQQILFLETFASVGSILDRQDIPKLLIWIRRRTFFFVTLLRQPFKDQAFALF